jgi:SAM-dependent methyltransferase
MAHRDEVKVYSQADFSEVNRTFARRIARRVGRRGRAADLGTGPASIALEFCAIAPGWQVLAVDASAGMLAEGRRLVQKAGLDGQIRFLRKSVLQIGGLLQFDLVFSNSVLHHLENPLRFWHTVADLTCPGGSIVVQDLRRPNDARGADRLVREHAQRDPPLLKRLFHQSLLAAFTPDEVREQLNLSGLGYLRVDVVSDRHLLVHGKRRNGR